MLDKFRCDYMVQFYGAVFISQKICMVTEFAKYGSLKDLMKARKEQKPRTLICLKMMLDGAKGIEYLHDNGILHRDIKPDNFLVITLEDNVPVNCKMTDFGSARNVNQMMTNMTFTKGIGSPAYMAPEILNKQKYKKPSDVYSFAITMYETLGWCECYPKKEFKFPWKIAEFVVNGNRRPQPDEIPENLYEIIKSCWIHNPLERIPIEDAISLLSSFQM